MKVIAFDLDDTLVKEREFCFSGFRAVAESLREVLNPQEVMAEMSDALKSRRNHYDALEELAERRGVPIDIKEAVNICRNHRPEFPQESVAKARRWIGEVLSRGYTPAIITDGRSVTQRNKLGALGLLELIKPENIFISSERGADKTSPVMFEELMSMHLDAETFVYVGDNIRKDFYHPRRLGWKTIGIRDWDGINIHPQSIPVEPEYQPDIWI